MREGFEKRFNSGDIAYWCHRDKNGLYCVNYGMVDEQFSDVVYIDYLEPRERRLVDGVPIEKFESEQRYRKLPKGWSCYTKLFDITYRELTEEEKEFKFPLVISDSEAIKLAYDKGFLVKSSAIFHGKIEVDITKEGFRVIKTYPMYEHHADYATIRPDKVYFTYEEAKNEVDQNIAELKRQAELSDYEWSLEQIDKTIGIFCRYHGYDDVIKQRYHDWFTQQKDVEDIETRCFGGNIEWRYWKNKRWRIVENL